MLAATDWTVVLTSATTAAAVLLGSYLTTRGQARIAREDRADERTSAQATRRQSDLMEFQAMLATLVANVARDASPQRPAGSTYILERVKMRQDLLAVLGRIGDSSLNRMVEGLFVASDAALGEMTPLDDIESDVQQELVAHDIGVGEIVRSVHRRVGELLREQ